MARKFVLLAKGEELPNGNLVRFVGGARTGRHSSVVRVPTGEVETTEGEILKEVPGLELAKGLPS